MLNVQNHGSIVLVGSDAADHLAFSDWLAENLGDQEVTFWGDSLVVEPRYVADFLYALWGAGFKISA